MWIGKILAGENTVPFADPSVVLDDLDPTTTARGDRLEDPECARVAGTLLLEEIIVLR